MPPRSDEEHNALVPRNAPTSRPQTFLPFFHDAMQVLRDTQMAVTFHPAARSIQAFSTAAASAPKPSQANAFVPDSSPPRGRLPRSAVPGEGPGTQKPFKCDHCDRWFSCLHNVKQHYNEKHNPDKPHKCELCAGKLTSKGKARGEFARPYTLNRHLRDVHDVEVPTGKRPTLGKRPHSESVEEFDSSDDESTNKSMRFHDQQDVHQSNNGNSSAALSPFDQHQTLQQPKKLALRPHSNANLPSDSSNSSFQNGHVSTPHPGTSHLNGPADALQNDFSRLADQPMTLRSGTTLNHNLNLNFDSLSSYLDAYATPFIGQSINSHHLVHAGRAPTSNSAWDSSSAVDCSDSISQRGQSSTPNHSASYFTSHPMSSIEGIVPDKTFEGLSNSPADRPLLPPHPSGLCLPGHMPQPKHLKRLTNTSNHSSNHSDRSPSPLNSMFTDLPCNPSTYSNHLSNQSNSVSTHLASIPNHSNSLLTSTIDPALLKQQPVSLEDDVMTDIVYDESDAFDQSRELPDFATFVESNMTHDYANNTNSNSIDLAGIGSWMNNDALAGSDEDEVF